MPREVKASTELRLAILYHRGDRFKWGKMSEILNVH